MPTLAPKLPWTHPFAGGYPRVAGQALPTDPDAIDYLERVKAADGGVGVEVGVAMAVDAFVKGLKEDGIFPMLKTSCLLCGPRTISGALVPLVGPEVNADGLVSGDYDRVTGLTSQGGVIDTNVYDSPDDRDDFHMFIDISAVGGNAVFIDSGSFSTGDCRTFLQQYSNQFFTYNRSGSGQYHSLGAAVTGQFAMWRYNSYAYMVGLNAAAGQYIRTANPFLGDNVTVAPATGRLRFYSYGNTLATSTSATTYNAFRSRISAYTAAIAAAL